MTTCLGKSCSFGLPRVPFVNCCQFMYLVISILVLRAGCGICLYLFTLKNEFTEDEKCQNLMSWLICQFPLITRLGALSICSTLPFAKKQYYHYVISGKRIVLPLFCFFVFFLLLFFLLFFLFFRFFALFFVCLFFVFFVLFLFFFFFN